MRAQDALHLGRVAVDDGVAAGGDAGIVDEDADGPQLVEGLSDHGLAGVVVRDVGLEGGGLTAEVANRAGDLLGGLGVAGVVDRDIGAGLGEGVSDRGTDSATAAGDQGRSAV